MRAARAAFFFFAFNAGASFGAAVEIRLASGPGVLPFLVGEIGLGSLFLAVVAFFRLHPPRGSP